MTYDQEISIGKSHLQYGHYNDRIYVMKFDTEQAQVLLEIIHTLQEAKHFGKIIIKIPASESKVLSDLGYQAEAMIPGYYGGGEPCLFMVRYADEKRRFVGQKELIIADIDRLKEREASFLDCDGCDYTIRELSDRDIPQMLMIFRNVFSSYPFPIHDPSYLRICMESTVKYFGVFDDDRLIGVSSCETDPDHQSVEMTDFAIDPDYRGRQLSRHLLTAMEEAMREQDYFTAYTIARSGVGAMNATFASEGYRYTGTLWNNTNIGGQIESMNVWYKPLHVSKEQLAAI